MYVHIYLYACRSVCMYVCVCRCVYYMIISQLLHQHRCIDTLSNICVNENYNAAI